MTNEKKVAELMETLENIKAELEQLKVEDSATVQEMNEKCEQVTDGVDEKDGAEIATEEQMDQFAQGWQSYPSILASLYRSIAAEERALGDENAAEEWERSFAESQDSFNREVYKGIRKDMEFGRFKNEAAFLDEVKIRGLEFYAIEDGYDLDNPSEETLSQWAKIHTQKTPEEDAFEMEKLAHELNGMLIGDRIAGSIGSAIGGAIGSFFGFFAGATEAAEIKRLSRG